MTLRLVSPLEPVRPQFQSQEPLPELQPITLPPTLSGAAWWAIAAVVAVALLLLSGAGGTP
jgi:hypothetical protein